MGLMQDVRDFMELDRKGKLEKINQAIDDRVCAAGEHFQLPAVFMLFDRMLFQFDQLLAR